MTAAASLETRTAWINESRYEALSKEIARINRRAARLSVPGYTLTRESTRIIQVSVDDPSGASRMISVRQVEVKVVGQPVCLSGWTFAATIQHLSDGADNILRVAPAFQEASIPTQYRTASSSVCDHCCTARFRRETYILHSEKGEWKQVGSTCIADFLGSDAAHAVARAEMAFAIGIAMNDAGNDRDYSRNTVVSTQNFLACTIACVKAKGWVSRKEAREGHAQATADLALEVMRGFGPKGSKSIKTSDEDYKTALEVMEWGKSLAERDNLNDYMWNLRAAFAGDFMPGRAEGIIASGYIAFMREKENERTRKGSSSIHIGEVGQRMSMVLEVVGVRSISSEYGVTTLVSFVTSEGALVKWFASGDKTSAFKVGKTYRGDVTVKKHDEWQGTKQTIVTRCFLALAV